MDFAVRDLSPYSPEEVAKSSLTRVPKIFGNLPYYPKAQDEVEFQLSDGEIHYLY